MIREKFARYGTIFDGGFNGIVFVKIDGKESATRKTGFLDGINTHVESSRYVEAVVAEKFVPRRGRGRRGGRGGIA